MPAQKGKKTYIKVRCENTLYGDLSTKFSPSQRWSFIALLCMCALETYAPRIKATPKTGYTDEQLSEFLNINIHVWRAAKERLVEEEFIRIEKNNVIVIRKWRSYQSEFERQRKYRADAREDDTELTKMKLKIANKAIDHLNQRTGRHLSPKSKSARKHISARIDEGAVLDDFINAIDNKVEHWYGTEMGIYLRPETLFNGAKFWGYANENRGKKVRTSSPLEKKLSKEALRAAPTLKEEYHSKLKATMREQGWESLSDVNWFEVPSEKEYLEREMIKIDQGERDAKKETS